MENYIVIESSKKMKEIARAALAGKWKAMVLGVFIYYIFSQFIPSILDLFFSYEEEIELLTGEWITVKSSFASSVYEFLLAGPLLLGMLMFLLAFFRKHTIDYALTFEGFSMLKKGILLYLMYAIRIFLWSLLLFIPGIIATFRYSQAFYLRVDNPDWSSAKCLAESSRLMKGNKAKFFWLHLSFIGWYLLGSIPGLFMTFFVDGGIQLLIAGVICSIPALFIDLYIMMTETTFYEILVGNLVVREESPFDQQDEQPLNQDVEAHVEEETDDQ